MDNSPSESSETLIRGSKSGSAHLTVANVRRWRSAMCSYVQRGSTKPAWMSAYHLSSISTSPDDETTLVSPSSVSIVAFEVFLPVTVAQYLINESKEQPSPGENPLALTLVLDMSSHAASTGNRQECSHLAERRE